jgi:hypothetical protein
MEPHKQSPWYLHEIPSYAKASEGYPQVAKSAEALILRRMNDPIKAYAFIHEQSPWSSAQADKFIITEKIPVSRNISKKEVMVSLENIAPRMLFLINL